MPLRIGILGGSFDPLHSGHLIIARTVYEKLSLDEVLFVPCYLSPLKKMVMDNQVNHHRLKMLQLALKGNPHFKVLDMEIKRGGVSYTIDTMRALKKSYPPKTRFYFIIGSDTLGELPEWHEIREVVKLCQLVTIARPGYLPPDFKRIKTNLGVQISRSIQENYLSVPSIDISSTEIRNRVRKSLPIKYLVPETVEKYIKRYRLYKKWTS